MSNKKSGFLKIFLGKPLISEKSVVSWGCRKIAERWAMEEKRLEMLKQLAAGVATASPGAVVALLGMLTKCVEVTRWANCHRGGSDPRMPSSNHPAWEPPRSPIVQNTLKTAMCLGRSIGSARSDPAMCLIYVVGCCDHKSVRLHPCWIRNPPSARSRTGHAVYPQPAGGRDGHLLHQLRRVGADDDPEHHRRSAVHPGQGADGARAHHQCQPRPGRAHRAVRGPGGQARGPDEQGRQGPGHPVPERPSPRCRTPT